METKQAKKSRRALVIGSSTAVGTGLGALVGSTVVDEITGEVLTEYLVGGIVAGAVMGGGGAVLACRLLAKAANDPHCLDQTATWMGKKWARMGKWIAGE